MGGNRAQACLAAVIAVTLLVAIGSAVAMREPSAQVASTPVAASPLPTAARTAAPTAAPRVSPPAQPRAHATVAAPRPARTATASRPRAAVPSLLGDILFQSDRLAKEPPNGANPDGTVTATSEGLDIWVMHADGSKARPLTTSGFDSQASMSPDGRRVAWVRRNNELWVMASDGSAARRLFHCPLACQQPRWSPDGRQLAFVTVDAGQRGRGHGMVMGSDGTGARAVVPQLNAFMITWSPDGRRFAVSVGADGKNNGLYVTDAKGHPTRIYGKDGYPADAPDWSPDGSVILFSEGNDLYTIRPDGSGLRQLTGTEYENLTDEPGQHMNGSWSRNGQTIAFEYFEHSSTAKARIGVMRADGTGERLLTDGTADCSSPRF